MRLFQPRHLWRLAVRRKWTDPASALRTLWPAPPPPLDRLAAATAALRTVVDPLLNRDVVESGIASIEDVEGGPLRVTLDVTTAAHPDARDIAERCAAALENAKNVGGGAVEVSVNATGFGRSVAAAKHPGLSSVRSAIAISSCKGGVGKTTVALQTAFALEAAGARVGYFDADVHGPSVPAALGIPDAKLQPSPAGGGLALPIEHAGVRFTSLGWVAPPSGAGGAMRGPLTGRVAMQLLTMTDWGELDYLIIDLPPGVGDVALSLCQTIALDGAVVVTTPSELARVDVLRGVSMLRSLGVRSLALVENMAYFECGSCTERHRVFGPGHVQELREQLDLAADACFEVPLSPAISAENERGSTRPTPRPKEPVRPPFDQLARHIVRDVYLAQHAQRNVVFDAAWHASRGVLVARRFDADGATERVFSPRTLRAFRKAPLDDAKLARLKPTAVDTIAQHAVSIDWSDGAKQEVYTFAALFDPLDWSDGANERTSPAPPDATAPPDAPR